MQTELLQLRSQLSAAIKLIDGMLAGSPTDDDVFRYRSSPGGMLSDEGVAEMYRRFDAGETDAVIARAMAFSVQAVQKRRGLWQKERRVIG